MHSVDTIKSIVRNLLDEREGASTSDIRSNFLSYCDGGLYYLMAVIKEDVSDDDPIYIRFKKAREEIINSA